MDPQFFDTKLTNLGLDQAEIACRGFNEPDSIQLIIVSPLTRALQTATVIFPGKKLIAKEEIRERIGTHPCDKRRSVDVLTPEFPHVDFSELLPLSPSQHTDNDTDNERSLKRSNDDIFWSEQRESFDQMERRARDFMRWMANRPEQTLAVVTHNDFLQIIFQSSRIKSVLQHNGEASEEKMSEDSQFTAPFVNCEIRKTIVSFF